MNFLALEEFITAEIQALRKREYLWPLFPSAKLLKKISKIRKELNIQQLHSFAHQNTLTA